MPAWQLKMTGQEAAVSFSRVTIWSKFSSAGAFSWFIGMLSELILKIFEILPPLLDFLGQFSLKSGAFLGVDDLKVEVNGVAVEPY